MHIFQKGNEGNRIYKHARIKDFLGSFRFFLSRYCLNLFWQNLQEGIGKKE